MRAVLGRQPPAYPTHQMMVRNHMPPQMQTMRGVSPTMYRHQLQMSQQRAASYGAGMNAAMQQQSFQPMSQCTRLSTQLTLL